MTSFFERTIIRNFNIPDSVTRDSCYYGNTLLRIEIDKKSRVSHTAFSDNAEDWLVIELNRVQKELDMKWIGEQARKANFKNGNIVIPVVISGGSPCESGTHSYWFNKKYFQFNGQNLRSANLFLNPVEILFHSLNK